MQKSNSIKDLEYRFLVNTIRLIVSCGNLFLLGDYYLRVLLEQNEEETPITNALVQLQ